MDFFTPSKDKCLIWKRYEEPKDNEKEQLKTEYKAQKRGKKKEMPARKKISREPAVTILI